MNNPPLPIDPAAPGSLNEALHRWFGFREFREGQDEAVDAVLNGRDAVVIMPTGCGKSLCFQLAAMMLGGVTLVVSPLIALMKDQVDSMQEAGLPATFINSSLTMSEMNERISGLQSGQYKLLYVAPERFRNQRFMTALAQVQVSLLAVDEAHCISQWGHDFRPDYLRLGHTIRHWPGVRIMALTATATPDVREDIVRQLGLGDQGRPPPDVLVYGFERPNLHLAVNRSGTHENKHRRMIDLLRQWPTGIIYCSTRKQVEKVYTRLKAEGMRCGFYHGGLEQEERKQVQNRFMSGEVPVVVATNAFGMGIDRADLRCVIHWDVPGSLEAYYQEVGRAGRDGEPAHCELLYNYADVRTQEFFIEGANPTPEEVRQVFSRVRRDCIHGPVQRSLDDWAAAMGRGANGMMVRTVMGILERAGLIVRFQEPGQRISATDLAVDADLAVLEKQFPAMEQKRRRDEAKLQRMLAYVNTHACRQADLLHYFGELEVPERCGNCDHCAREAGEGPAELKEDQWVELQMVLSCAARMEGRYGQGRIAQVLMGSRAKPLLESGMDKLSTYGLMKGAGEAYIKHLINELLMDGSLRIAGGEYPLVEITARGKQVMWRKTLPRITWPKGRIPKKSAATRSAEPGSELYDEGLFEQLKTWRNHHARAQGVPAYVVLHNRTLKAIAVVMPTDLAELESVHGMGPARVKKYGAELLALLKK